ncbi:transcription elongation factor GreA [Spirochaeta dissipatitropha]
MAESTIGTIAELLKEETWTRAALNNYTIANLKELDDLLEKIEQLEEQEEILALCDEHLQHTKNSIIALYLSGIIQLSRQSMNDGHLIMLVNLFSDNHKWKIVEYLCERILEFGENKYALRTLVDCYSHENKTEEVFPVYERLIKVDFEEAQIVRELAEKYESDGNLDEAVAYYKKALHRYINKKLFSNVKDIWHKLIEYCPLEIEFFYHAEKKIAKSLSEERAVQLLEDYYPVFIEKKDWDTTIDLLKKILTYDSDHHEARKEIVNAYTQKYAGHSHLDEYVKLSNLGASWRNIHEAISDFEKHISFDAGNFVFHRTWGVGRIRSIDDDEIVIDFAKKRKHTMSLKMAVNALQIMPKDHIAVLRSAVRKEKLREKVKKNPVWALRTVIKSLNNAADMKMVKAELVPAILTPSEWTSWSTKARELLKTDESFGNLQDKLDYYMVRENPITLDEKIYNRFKAESDFFDRVKTLFEFQKYTERDDSFGLDNDYFREMFDYFVSFIRNPVNFNEMVVGSHLVVRRIAQRYSFLNPGVDLDFHNLFSHIENVDEVFSNLKDNDLKRDFLTLLRKNSKEWPQYYVRFFNHYVSKDIINELSKHEHYNELKAVFFSVFDNYRDRREAFIWLVKNCADDEWFKKIDITYEKLLINMVHLLDITFRDIDNKKDATGNRRLNKQIQAFLFKENKLIDFLMQAEKESVERIYTLLVDVKDLDPSLRLSIRHEIQSTFPDLQFYDDAQEKEVFTRGGFMVLQQSFEDKQKRLQHIHEVEVPQNSKEIAVAREYGDLKENAEYKAAKERQDMLNSTVARLKEEIEKASVVAPREFDDSKISFGTVVELKNLESEETEIYTVLGPWESDPDNGVISYLSPLGSKLYGKTEGEELHFEINERNYSYLVKDVSKAKV